MPPGASRILGCSPFISIMTRHLLPLFALAISAVTGAESTPRRLDWSTAQPVHAAHRTLLVLDTPAQTALRGRIHKSKQATESTLQVAGEPATSPAAENFVDLTLDWLNHEPPTDFQRAIDPATGILRSTCRLDSATVTRTVLVDPDDGTVFIHLLANLPGALSFRVSLGGSDEGEPRIEDRRELILTSADGISAHVRVVPFESDVTPDGNSILVRGEGEALVVLSYATGLEAAKSLAATWKMLGERHDPGNIPADPSRIWHEVVKQRRKSVENSP